MSPIKRKEIKMYIKINKKSQLALLRSINCYLGKNKIPCEVFHELRYILEVKSVRKGDYIALFIEPVKNDTTDIMDSLHLYSHTGASDEDFHNIYFERKTQQKKKVWSWYTVNVNKYKHSIFVVYCIKKKDLDERGGF